MAKKEEKHLDSALLAAGIEKLPKEVFKGKFIGEAIIKMRKVGGRITWGLGRWSSELRKVLVSQDFDNKMVEEILEARPYESQFVEDETPTQRQTLKLKRAYLEKCGYDPKNIQISAITTAKANKLIAEIEALQAKIVELGGKAEDKTVEELEAIIDDLKKPKDEVVEKKDEVVEEKPKTVKKDVKKEEPKAKEEPKPEAKKDDNGDVSIEDLEALI